MYGRADRRDARRGRHRVGVTELRGGRGIILTALGVPETIGTVFMALVLVRFLLTSMDTGVRLGRYMVEEIVGTPETTAERYMADKHLNSSVIIVVAFFLVASGSWGDL